MTYKVTCAACGSTKHSTDSSLGIMVGIVSWNSVQPLVNLFAVLAYISITLSYGGGHAS